MTQPRYSVARVAKLPMPHLLFKCPYQTRLENARRSAGVEDGADTPMEVGQAFLDGLTAADLLQCDYHRPDWMRIALGSVRLLRALGRRPSRNEVLAYAARNGLSDEDALELQVLFAQPIMTHAGATSLTNGQHRVCALKKAGVGLCAVER